MLKVMTYVKKIALWSVFISLTAFILFILATLIMFKVNSIGTTAFDQPSIEIPYGYNSTGHIVIDVEIKGKKYPFIMDSGGSNRLSSQFGLEDDDFRFFGFGIDSNGTLFSRTLVKVDEFLVEDIVYKGFTLSKMEASFIKCAEEGLWINGKEAVRHYIG